MRKRRENKRGVRERVRMNGAEEGKREGGRQREEEQRE